MKIIVVDGGGTSTDFVSYDISDGEVIEKVTYPTCHIMQVGSNKMGSILKAGLSDLDYSEDDYIVFGLAGYGNNKYMIQEIDEVIKSNFHSYNYHITSDVHLAYYSEFQIETGILVILGTGSIAYKYVNGSYHRAGGWGYGLGDEASGYYLGKLLLTAFTKQADGRHKKTDLYYEVKEKLDLDDDYDIIKKNITMTREEIADLSHLVFDLFEKADVEAIKIIDNMIDEIVELLNALYDSSVNEVILFGGITKSNIDIVAMVENNLANKVSVRKASNNPTYGGYLIAKELVKNNKWPREFLIIRGHFIWRINSIRVVLSLGIVKSGIYIIGFHQVFVAIKSFDLAFVKD